MVTSLVQVITGVFNGLFSGLGEGIANFAKYLLLEYTVGEGGVVTWSTNLSTFATYAIALGAVATVIGLVVSLIRKIGGRRSSN